MSTSHTAAALPGTMTPPVRQGLFTTGNEDAALQQAVWQRAMEQAQVAAWFKPPVTQGQGSTAAQPVRGPEASSRKGMGDVGSTAGTSIGSVPGGAVSWSVASSDALAMGVRIGAGHAIGGAAQVSRAAAYFLGETALVALAETAVEAKVPADARTFCGAGSVQSASEPVDDNAPGPQADVLSDPVAAKASMSEIQTPLRLHEETMPQGQAVWIAMRADDEVLAAMLPRIVADLQRAMTQDRGQRLYQVVCNGRLVWRDRADAPMSEGSSIPDGDHRQSVFDSDYSKGT